MGINMDMDLTGRVAVITGGSGILCSNIAKHLAKKGVKIVVIGTTEEKVNKVASEIIADGGDAIGVRANVLDKESMEEACGIVMKKYGTIDILINGAGGNKPEATTGVGKSFFDLPPDAIKSVADLNFVGSVIPTQVFGKIFADKKKGCIINISSMAAYTPLTRTIAYSAAKAAVTNFTQWMAVHFNQEYSPNIRVNAIAPGFLLTEQNYYLLIDKETGKPTERGAKIIAGTPMGRYGEPDELVGAIIFLCSDAASFVNGAVIPIDGGFSAYSGV